MIFAFKKLNGKALSVLSILKIFHVDKGVQTRFNVYQPNEVLEIGKQRVQGFYSIVNYLSDIKRSAVAQEKLWWLSFQFKESCQAPQKDGTTLKKRLIKSDNIKELNRILEQSTFLEGDKLSEADVIAYVKIRTSGQEVKPQGKLAAWLKELSTLVDPILEEAKTLYKSDKKPEKADKKADKKDIKKDEGQKDEKPKDAPKPDVGEVKKDKKVKQKEEITPEYQAQFNALKVKRSNFGQPILPDPQKKNILITSALPYVNNVPHLGNIIGCVLSADSYARFCRLRGHNTLFVCGTDEYGTATEVKALQEKLTPQQICDKYFAIHKKCYEWFDIDFDYFGRTSTPAHNDITQGIFNHLYPKYTTQQTKEQLHCKNCDLFLADRYVQGTCPGCNYQDANGDQCDACGALSAPEELINPKCFICGTKPELKETTHIYINLPIIQERLEKWLLDAAEKGKWSNNSLQMSKGWLKKGLIERCITRDLKWGVPVPLEEFKKKVFYVWFDAPIGYLSITANFIKEWEQWWKNPDVKLYQFMGKDNVPFHTVIFPSTLLGTEQQYTMLHHISTTEYLNYEDDKFSKRKGVGVFGDNAMDSGIPAEIFRYYLLVNRPEKADTVFTWKDFGDKNNNELLPNLGNLINRALKFVYANYDKAAPTDVYLKPNDIEFIQQFFSKFEEYIQLFEEVQIKESLKKAMELSSLVNKYLQDEKAWETEQKKSKRSDTILLVALNAIRVVSATIEPFMPAISAKINFQLGFNDRKPADDVIFETLLANPDRVKSLMSLVAPGQKLNQPLALFRTFTTEELENWRRMYSGQK